MAKKNRSERNRLAQEEHERWLAEHFIGAEAANGVDAGESVSTDAGCVSLKERASAAEQARLALHQVVKQFGRSRDERARAILQSARDEFYRSVNDAYPPGFHANFESFKKGNLHVLDIYVRFLEADPWFFSSGYAKANILRVLKRLDLPKIYRERLRRVIVKVVIERDRRELRSYRGLSLRIMSDDLERELRALAEHHTDPNVRRRARWVLDGV